MRIKLSRIKSIYLYLTVLFLVLGTDAVWVKAEVAPLNYYLIDIIATVLMIYVLGYFCKNHSNNMLRYCALAMIASIVLSSLFNLSNDFLAVYKCAVIFIGTFLCSKIDFKRFADVFNNTIVYISLFSLICIFFQDEFLNMSFIPVINYGLMQFKSVFFMNILTSQYNELWIRNQGPYWEPGAYQAFLNIALIFLLFKDNEYRNTKYYFSILIIITAIFTTLSTTGIIVMFIIIYARIHENTHRKHIDRRLIILAAFAIIGILWVNDELFNRLFDKFYVDSLNAISYSTRINSFFLNIKLITENPIFGIGITEFRTLYSINSEQILTMDTDVNTITSLSAWGIFGFAYFIIFNGLFLIFAKHLAKKRISRILIITAIFLMLNTEDWTFSIFWNVLPLFAVNNSIKSKYKEE